MKKYLFLAVAAVAMIVSGCKDVESSEISGGASSADQVSIRGYARYIAYDKNGQPEEPEILDNTAIVLFQGSFDEDSVMQYKRIELKTDGTGYFSTELNVESGKVTIDEVKVQCRQTIPDGSYAFNQSNNKMERADTEFFAEIVKKNLTVGNAYYFALDLVPVAYTSDPDFKQPEAEKKDENEKKD